MSHGTTYEYDVKGCRCEECRAKNAQRHKEARHRRLRRATPSHVHGTGGGYANWGCRCDPCVEAYGSYPSRKGAT